MRSEDLRSDPFLLRESRVNLNLGVAEATYLLRLGLEDSPEFDFQPGQFVQVQCGLTSRPFVIFGREADPPGFLLLVRDRGAGTHWLTSRQPGDKVYFQGPCGKGFRLDSLPLAEPVLLVGEGIGLASQAALARRLLADQHPVTLVATAPANWVIPGELISAEPAFSYHVQVTPRLQQAERLFHILAQPHYARFSQVFLGLAPTSYPLLLRAGLLGQLDSSSFQNPQIYLQKVLPCGVGVCDQCGTQTREGRRLVCVDGPAFYFQDIIWRV